MAPKRARLLAPALACVPQAGATEEGVQAALVPGPDDPQPLTQEEVLEKEELLNAGFISWTRK